MLEDMRRWSWRVGLALGLALASLLALPPLERHFLYRGGGPRASAHAATGLREDVASRVLLARDGTVVRALELPAERDAKTVVLFHNNRETAEEQLGLADALHARGLGVVVLEYRGYGGSAAAGAPTEDGLYGDAEAVLAMLAARGVGSDRIILFGISLGTGVAAEMARRGHGAALVLVSPYTSIPELVRAAVPGIPAQYMLPDRFETGAKTAEIRVPTLVVHGDADEIVPFWMGERIAHGVASGRLYRVRGGHHGDLFAREGAALVTETAAL
jgi:alpha-beta hydrolase superfamily lysophospholipase